MFKASLPSRLPVCPTLPQHGRCGDPAPATSVGVDLLATEDWLDRYVGVEHLGQFGPRIYPVVRERHPPVLPSWKSYAKNGGKRTQ
jgi:hypothetical protein